MKPAILLAAIFLLSTRAIAAPATLSIQEIEDKSAAHLKGDCDLVGIWASPGEAIRELLTDEISKVGGVELVERELVNKIYENEFEQKNLEKPAAKKKFIAANYVLAGVVSEFESCVSNQNSKVDVGSLLGIGGLEVGSQSSTAHVALDLRLIEVKTGKIAKTFHSSGRIEDEGISLSVDVLGNRLNRDSFEKVPLGKATRMAVADAVAKIAAELKK
jgi:curli biogenesis system outer membrane secretion channel CsgG